MYQFERLRAQEGLDCLRALAPDVAVTAAFGQILSKKLLAVPKFGTVNAVSYTHLDVYKRQALLRVAMEPALRELLARREREGAAMAADLARRGQTIARALAAIERRAPEKVAAYHAKLRLSLIHLYLTRLLRAHFAPGHR